MTAATTALPLLALLGAVLGVAVLAPSGAAGGPEGPATGRPDDGPSQGMPPNDRARGRVYDGLAPGREGTLCHGLYEVKASPNAQGAAAGLACTHGPDDAPEDASVAHAVAPMSPAAIAGAPRIACPAGDDGVSGLRVQAVYAYEEGKPNRYASFATSFPAYAGNVEATYSASAAQTGGVRHVRWVTDAECGLDVRVVAVPAGSLASIGTMRDALAAKGLSSASRKYLVWADSSVYCGIGYLYADDSRQGDGSVNANDGKYAMYARVDNGCWGLANSVEAHELMHNLGGVQASAPHATAGSHCTDNADRMCYDDGRLKAGQSMLTLCASTQERLLDCNHDDYYHTAPAAGSYLATHWNAAASRFLFSTDPAPSSTPTPTTTASPGTATTSTSPTGTPFTAAFAPRAMGNDWWVEVQVTASKPVAKVEAKVDGGAWTALPANSWGTYSKSLHAPDGSSVTFRATDATGAMATSQAYPWKEGGSTANPPTSTTTTTTTTTTGATTTTTSTSGAPFTASFAPRAMGNDWWVEVQVTASRPVAKVEARIGDGAWTTLPANSWGTYSKSLHAPDGSSVTFRATDSAGALATSQAYPWKEGASTAGPTSTTTTTTATATTSTSPTGTPFTASFEPRAVGNDWWIEAKVTGSSPVAKVEAKVGGGAWTVLPPNSWGTHSKSLHAPNGSLVAFRATDAAGAVVTGPTHVWT